MTSSFLDSALALAAALHCAASLPEPARAHGLATGALLADDLAGLDADGRRARAARRCRARRRTERRGARPRCLRHALGTPGVSWLEARARASGRTEALRIGGRTLDYAQLWAHTRELVRAADALGVRAGDPLALLATGALDAALLLHAAQAQAWRCCR